MKSLFTYIFTICFFALSAQSGSIEGSITDGDGPVPFATVGISELGIGTTSTSSGYFFLEGINEGNYELVVRGVGYQTKSFEIQIRTEETTRIEVELSEDLIQLNQIVVSGTRNAIPLFEAPVIVSRIDDRLFESTQSVTLSEGLSFSPGLRLENNCQNCGFTQLRMNGLEGAYSQILINSRPIFSSLLGVYGLDFIPANMIDRVEVVRGGGSVLYGGNAVAGTVNILTKDPLDNSVQIGYNQAFVNMEAPDATLTLNGSIVSEDLNMGLNLYGFNRNRDHWDANGDGFSEVTLLENTTFGFDAFYKPSALSRIELNGFFIDEFRRGGSDFDLLPHQTQVTEQVDHRILGGSISYERFSADYRHKISIYASGQSTDRASYYGGGGRVLSFGDELTDEDVLAINAYGNSSEISGVGGIQYGFEISEAVNLTAGSEFEYNEVEDQMPGYDRFIDQDVSTWGNYAQFEIKPIDRLTVLAGGRYDIISINGKYSLLDEHFINDQNLGVFVPRASLMYDLTERIKLRGSFAQGYRAPQAYDEELHIETVGGAALFTRLDPDLEMERSNSYTLSVNYSKSNENIQFNYLAEVFLTDLMNPFIASNQVELPNGVAVITQRNGSGAIVSGVNLEANVAVEEKWILSAGLTLQTAQYDEDEELWSPDEVTDANSDSVITTSNILRTPNTYGYLSLTYRPNQKWSITYSGVYTGSMDVPHVIDPETEFTIIEETPEFFESNLKISRTFKLGAEKTRLEVFAGMQNIFNSFQDDFDIGPNRDPSYIYGPTRPRTAFFGVKFGM